MIEDDQIALNRTLETLSFIQGPLHPKPVLFPLRLLVDALTAVDDALQERLHQQLGTVAVLLEERLEGVEQLGEVESLVFP